MNKTQYGEIPDHVVAVIPITLPLAAKALSDNV
jgi:hypothetical protein